ncbi:PREDICTED: WSCD family member AGAP003962-like [Papilio polytes]|uniref:WSCD family member AGAP003962-like n=1 Tax=Papilio polytes TaxID=76194 RepID=UPI00067685F9|nr:PREDICTED: WSCD family member AGAP003962-like [Papilio polytes]
MPLSKNIIKMLRKLISILVVTVASFYIFFIFTVVNNYAKQISNDKSSTNNRSVYWCKELHWRMPPLPFAIALASYPGSGNTWLRYLLQQTTGIITGSVYLDYNLRSNGFPAENISDGSVLVVKTHQYPPKTLEQFESAVLLIRNPRDAILAEFNRHNSGHTGNAPKSAFEIPALKRLVWFPYFSTQLRDWEYFHNLWLTKFPGQVYIVFYEALLTDTRKTLLGILNFLNITVTEDDMNCALANKEGLYKRKKKYKEFDPYTHDMYRQIDIVRTRVYTKIIESIK